MFKLKIEIMGSVFNTPWKFNEDDRMKYHEQGDVFPRKSSINLNRRLFSLSPIVGLQTHVFPSL